MKIVKTENSGAKYSEMIMNLYNAFENEFPEELAIEDVIENIVEAWNFSNHKTFLESNNLYSKLLKEKKYDTIIEKIIDYKFKNYSEFNNHIIEFVIESDKLTIKSQTQDEYFKSMINSFINPATNNQTYTLNNDSDER